MWLDQEPSRRASGRRSIVVFLMIVSTICVEGFSCSEVLPPRHDSRISLLKRTIPAVTIFSGSSTSLSAAATYPTTNRDNKPSRRHSIQETRAPQVTDQAEWLASEMFDTLLELVNRQTKQPPTTGISLVTGLSGLRGVRLTKPVPSDEAIIKIPLSCCLCDQAPLPGWLLDNGELEWSTRLAAVLLDKKMKLQQRPTTSMDDIFAQWFDLLPTSKELRASLPVHWPDHVIQSARCTAFELGVDAAYFGRSVPLQTLSQGWSRALLQMQGPSDRDGAQSTVEVEHALDIVQTRACRVSLDDLVPTVDDFLVRGQASGIEGNIAVSVPPTHPPLRLLAPLFDMINHSHRPTAYFRLEKAEWQNDCDAKGVEFDLVVRASATYWRIPK
jgi:hypothetical protein